jgi:hypothetical protein
MLLIYNNLVSTSYSFVRISMHQYRGLQPADTLIKVSAVDDVDSTGQFQSLCAVTLERWELDSLAYHWRSVHELDRNGYADVLKAGH